VARDISFSDPIACDAVSMARWLRLLGVSLLVGVTGGIGVVVAKPDTPWPAVTTAGGLAIALVQERFKQSDSQQEAALRTHGRLWRRWDGLPKVRRVPAPTLLRRRGPSAIPAYVQPGCTPGRTTGSPTPSTG
jgi:hypothetical protein